MLSNADLVVILKRIANHSSLTALKHLFKQKSNVISANRHSITLNAKKHSTNRIYLRVCKNISQSGLERQILTLARVRRFAALSLSHAVKYQEKPLGPG